MSATVTRLHLTWLVIAVAAAAAYFIIRDEHQLGAVRVAVKMAFAGSLALWMLPQSRWFAAVLGLASIGDGLIDANIYLGAAAFIAAHIGAIGFYRRWLRPSPSASQRMAAAAFLVLTPVIALLVLPQPPDLIGALVYAPIVGAMAAAAWLSRFSRYRTGVGAVLFVVSDLLIFAQPGALAGSAAPALLIWPLYAAAQVMIALGVARGLKSRDEAGL